MVPFFTPEEDYFVSQYKVQDIRNSKADILSDLDKSHSASNEVGVFRRSFRATDRIDSKRGIQECHTIAQPVLAAYPHRSTSSILCIAYSEC
jgi:predicted transcriptional regulator